MIATIKSYLREWQAILKDVRDRLKRDFDWARIHIPNEITLQMHFSHPKWELCNKTMIEQMQQKYDFARARFEDEESKNKWIVEYEARMMKNLREGVTDAIDRLFETQDEFFVPEQSNYAVSHQSGSTVSYTEIGPDGMPMDMHFDIDVMDVDAEDLIDMF